MPVTLEIRDGIALLTLDHPPVNALGASVKTELGARLDAALGDASVRAIVIMGGGRHFSAGADIREFDAGTNTPSLPDLTARIEKAGKPIIAAMHGTVAGGALELAIACHGRVAEEGAQLSLPEVTLGILPGAGGTVRLPRLIGVEAALDLILNGRKVAAAEAAALRLVDEAVPRGTLLARAANLA